MMFTHDIEQDKIISWYGEVSIQARYYYDKMTETDNLYRKALSDLSDALNKVADMAGICSSSESIKADNKSLSSRIVEIQAEINKVNRKIADMEDAHKREICAKDRAIEDLTRQNIALREDLESVGIGKKKARTIRGKGA